MHDIRAIRDNPAAFDAALARRGLQPMSDRILSLDADRRARIVAAETAQAEQNRASKEVGAAKARGDEAEFERLRTLVAEKKADVTKMQAEASLLDGRLLVVHDGTQTAARLDAALALGAAVLHQVPELAPRQA